MRIALATLGSIAFAVALFLVWPSPIDSMRFAAGPISGLEGPFEQNRILESCVRISEGEIAHADKVLLDSEGRLYAGDDRGRVLRLTPEADGGYAFEVFAEPGGTPMELDFDPHGNLIAADLRGPHFRVGPDGSSERIGTLEGLPLGTAGVAVSAEGLIYYGAHTEEIPGSPETEAFMSMLAARPTSELRVFDPGTGRETTLVEGLWLPVGVELSSDQDFVAVAEFFAYRVTRFWLKGPKAGTWDRLIENLPGFVDGLASDGEGTFYLTMPGYRAPFLDWMHQRPWLKNQLAKLLPVLLGAGIGPGESPGIVIQLDETGRVVRTFQDPESKVVGMVTGAEIFGGDLYLTSIGGDWIARCPLDG